MKSLYLLACLSLSLAFTSCAGFYIRNNTYEAATKPVLINGAEVKVGLKPMGGSTWGSFSALIVNIGAGSTDGPFIWRIEANGKEGDQAKLWVNSIHVATTTTNRSENYDPKLLKGKADFKPLRGKKNAGLTFANYQVFGELLVYPKKDGEITVTANVSVENSSGKVETKTIVFKLNPESSNDYENIFIPTEIINSFGQEDPTEWEW